ncbi:uroporphyrinogen-III synthase [Demequina sp. NBRC 110057]|uniref:uroporphyrinogen-III synthase n=1 Tax=Demequina sp. NBRC 110057 TaxID=1570346 RepID=UPI000A030D2A|nr:uroporphyrinogen-III synthase [Demequina sp. NBRC 110057]
MNLSILEGKRLLVPVTAQRRHLAQRLAAAGALVEEVEFIAIDGPSDPERLEEATLAWCAGDYDWMAVTSRNAVLAMDAIARRRGTSLGNAQPEAKVTTVGEATRSVCAEVGLEVTLVPTDKQNARGMVAEFPEGEGKILAPLGNLASPVLERGLARKGWSVDVVEAYRTVDGDGPDPDVREMLAHGTIDAVLLTSGSVAERLAATVPELSDDVMLIAIGDMTAAAARAAGFRLAAVAQAPSYDGIVAGLVEALSAAPAEADDVAEPEPDEPEEDEVAADAVVADVEDDAAPEAEVEAPEDAAEGEDEVSGADVEDDGFDEAADADSESDDAPARPAWAPVMVEEERS